MMHWILQENLFKETEWETLVGCLEKFDIPYSVHKVIPFIGELMPAPNVLATLSKNPGGKVVCFGSYSMRHAAKAHGWTPGVYDLFDANFLLQKQAWGAYMLNYDAVVVPFKDAIVERDTFIRPIDDSKYFAGKVFEAAEFQDWQRKVCVLEEDYGNSLTADTLIQLCNPKEIWAEYRTWVVNGRVVTASLYKRGDRVVYSDDVPTWVESFTNNCLNLWEPHHAFVFDVADTPDGPKIVEINTINSAGFYAADVQKLVMALEELEA